MENENAKVDFSEEVKAQGTHEETHGEDSSSPQKQNTPTMEELSKELEKAKKDLATKQGDYDRLKKSFDMTASDVAKYKKELQAKMTEDERKQAEQEEATKKANEELETLRAEVQKATSIKRYVGYGLNEKDSEACAKAELNHDMDTILKIVKGHHEADIKNRETEWLNKRPDPVVGGTSSGAKDPFEAGFG